MKPFLTAHRSQSIGPPVKINANKHVANQQNCYNYMYLFHILLVYLKNINPDGSICVQEIFKFFPEPTDVTGLIQCGLMGVSPRYLPDTLPKKGHNAGNNA